MSESLETHTSACSCMLGNSKLEDLVAKTLEAQTAIIQAQRAEIAKLNSTVDALRSLNRDLMGPEGIVGEKRKRTIQVED